MEALEENFIENIFKNGWKKATDIPLPFSLLHPLIEEEKYPYLHLKEYSLVRLLCISIMTSPLFS